MTSGRGMTSRLRNTRHWRRTLAQDTGAGGTVRGRIHRAGRRPSGRWAGRRTVGPAVATPDRWHCFSTPGDRIMIIRRDDQQSVGAAWMPPRDVSTGGGRALPENAFVIKQDRCDVGRGRSACRPPPVPAPRSVARSSEPWRRLRSRGCEKSSYGLCRIPSVWRRCETGRDVRMPRPARAGRLVDRGRRVLAGPGRR